MGCLLIRASDGVACRPPPRRGPHQMASAGAGFDEFVKPFV
jgi:hypothetical protein